jgi:hypothetical protein
MNINAIVINKIMANRNQQHIRKIIHHDKVGFFPRMQGWFNMQIYNVIKHISRSRQKPLVHLNRCRKSLDKIQNHFLIKALRKLGIERIYLNMVKGLYDKLIANIILNGETLESFSLKLGMTQCADSLHTCSA